jgi:hypothetical protein
VESRKAGRGDDLSGTQGLRELVGAVPDFLSSRYSGLSDEGVSKWRTGRGDDLSGTQETRKRRSGSFLLS